MSICIAEAAICAAIMDYQSSSADYIRKQESTMHAIEPGSDIQSLPWSRTKERNENRKLQFKKE